jgi:4a-hydroxytetrahydrobiopterin dehydratase
VLSRLAQHCADPDEAFVRLNGFMARREIITGEWTLPRVHRRLVEEFGLRFIPSPTYAGPMTKWITPGQFHDAVGVEDWRVLYDGAHAHFRTSSFAVGVALVDAIGQVAADRRPDVDLRSEGVSVALTTRDIDGLTERDVELARQISAVARGLGVVADPSAVQVVEVAVQALVISDVQPFWAAVLGYDERGPVDLVDRHGHGPTLGLQPMEVPRPQRNRIHVDISVPHDQAESRVAAAIAAGGRLVTDRYAPGWWVLADSEGNEACVATWMGRD